MLSPLHSPIPSTFREISTLASWTVSSSKPGCSIPQLRAPSTDLFWQSDGPQPHYLNIHFFKMVRIVGLRLFLNFEADESYTPTRMIFLAGSGMNDLVEWGEMRLEQPRGWIWADFSGVGDGDSDDSEGDSDDSDSDDIVPAALTEGLHISEDDHSDYENAEPTPSGAQPGRRSARARAQVEAMNIDAHGTLPRYQLGQQTTPHLPPPGPPSIQRSHPRRALHDLTPNLSPQVPARREKKHKIPVLRAHLVQIKILENHQNGKDTHLRGLQIFARDNEREREGRREVKGSARKSFGVKNGAGKGRAGGGGMRGLGKSPWDVEVGIR